MFPSTDAKLKLRLRMSNLVLENGTFPLKPVCVGCRGPGAVGEA